MQEILKNKTNKQKKTIKEVVFRFISSKRGNFWGHRYKIQI